MMMFQRQVCILIFVAASVSLVHGSWIKRSDEDFGSDENDAPVAPSIPGEGEGCSETQFKCKNGKCVKLESRCNGYNDCMDEDSDEDTSDESQESCNENWCNNSTEFHCPWDGYTTKCIPIENVCDENRDCGNGEDEKTCPCSEDQFKCLDGRCIPNSYKCDGADDCVDGSRSDESEETCSVNTCNNSTEFFCQWRFCVPSTCIPLERVCDKNQDCPGRDDELICPCSEDQFKCDNEKCIPNSYRCDGICGCTGPYCGLEDGSDESEEYCSVNRCNSTEFFCPWDGRRSSCIPLEKVCDRETNCRNGEDEKSCECTEDEFKCPNGICVPNERRCDGYNDCMDEVWTDDTEEYCSVNRCNSTEFFCPFYSYRSKCIPLESVCDRNRDCYNGEDEDTCPCLENEFKCKAGKCIPNSYTCDGDDDCKDWERSDESQEYCSVNHCNSTEFFCPWDGRRSKCIPLESACNENRDCPNGEDEKSCSCKDGKFRCDNGKCIVSKFRCDGEDDCDDNSDEVGCENVGKSANTTSDCRRVKLESKNPAIDIVIAVDSDVGDCLEEIIGEEGGTSKTKTSNSHKTAQVIVYKYKNNQGDRETMELAKGRCSNVPPGYNDQIESIDNLGNCVILYEHSDCVGQSAKLRPKSTFVAEDLARIKMKNYISSLEMC